jgi:hypothetical protein
MGTTSFLLPIPNDRPLRGCSAVVYSFILPLTAAPIVLAQSSTLTSHQQWHPPRASSVSHNSPIQYQASTVEVSTDHFDFHSRALFHFIFWLCSFHGESNVLTHGIAELRRGRLHGICPCCTRASLANPLEKLNHPGTAMRLTPPSYRPRCQQE